MRSKTIRRAVVLAAGRGTRMGEITADLPKAMLNVRGRPMLEHVLDGLATAGIAEFFLSLHQATGKQEYQDFARRALDNVVSRAFSDDQGYRWYQSEFRIQPWIVAAQTGYMQGAAGVGSALLHLHTALENQYHAVLFPYNPFPRDAAQVKA